VAARKQQDKPEVRTVAMVGSAIPQAGDKTEWTREERKALVARVLDGDKTAVFELRAMLAAHPDAAQRLWSPARTQRHALARRTSAPDDLLTPELFIAQAEAQQRELEGEHPTALERILCERVVTAQMIVIELETFPPPNVSVMQHEWMIIRAHERLLRATLTLAKVRRLLRPQVAQVNIAESGAQQLNVAQMPPRLPSE
jgi:hypothetical protein